MVERLLGASEALLREKPRSSAFRRRAVSTAYYAVFHALAKLAATSIVLEVPRDADEYLRVYRALDHGPVKTVFSQSPLREIPRLRGIGSIAVRLQSERVRADYLPPSPTLLPLAEAEDLVAQARQVVEDLETLSNTERRLLAICLLFKVRKD